MQFKQYQIQALTTIKPHDSKDLAICDWTLGLCGEISEVIECLGVLFDKGDQPELTQNETMELAKELGDVLWYLAAWLNELNMSVSEYNIPERCPKMTIDIVATILNLCKWQGKIAETIKHQVMHKEALDIYIIKEIAENLMLTLDDVATGAGFAVSDAAELNIAKLQHRYHNGSYSHEASANRHQQETKFTDTDIYRSLRDRIVGA